MRRRQRGSRECAVRPRGSCRRTRRTRGRPPRVEPQGSLRARSAARARARSRSPNRRREEGTGSGSGRTRAAGRSGRAGRAARPALAAVTAAARARRRAWAADRRRQSGVRQAMQVPVYACVPQGERLASGPVNAAVSLIERVLRSTAHVRATVPESHPSCRLLGNERMGSATIVDPAGLVLTVNYVVVGAEQVTVTLRDERAYVAEGVRQDFDSGLALLRIAEQGLPALPLRRTTDLTPGEDVFIVASLGDGRARVSNGAD